MGHPITPPASYDGARARRVRDLYAGTVGTTYDTYAAAALMEALHLPALAGIADDGTRRRILECRRVLDDFAAAYAAARHGAKAVTVQLEAAVEEVTAAMQRLTNALDQLRHA